jgi:hypothetical protein
MPSTLRLEITDAAGLLADTDFERFLRRQRFGARLREVVGKADNLTFGGLCNRVVGALANGIVRGNLQLFDVGADHDRASVGGDIPVGEAKAVDVQIAIAEVLVLLVGVCVRGTGFGLERSVLCGTTIGVAPRWEGDARARDSGFSS